MPKLKGTRLGAKLKDIAHETFLSSLLRAQDRWQDRMQSSAGEKFMFPSLLPPWWNFSSPSASSQLPVAAVARRTSPHAVSCGHTLPGNGAPGGDEGLWSCLLLLAACSGPSSEAARVTPRFAEVIEHGCEQTSQYKAEIKNP